MPTVSFTTKFNLVPATPVFVLTDTSDYAGQGIALANVNGSFVITAPSGTVIHNNTTYTDGGCDIKNSVARTNQTAINLPLAANGLPELGTYTIVYTVADVTGAVVYYTDTNTYTNEYARPEVAIDQEVDCNTPLFTSTDITEYTVEGIIPTITRTHTITYPVGSGLSPTVSVALEIERGSGEFANGTQTTTIASTLLYTFDDGLLVADSTVGYQEILVTCSDTCLIYCCLKTAYNNMVLYRTTNTALYPQALSIFNQAMSISGLIDKANTCGESEDISAYIAELQTITNCSTACTCTDTASLVS
jgi:hypothetical protein